MRITIWHPDVVLEAIRAWTVENGRPPAAGDWSTASPGHPHARTVLDRFGSWNNGIRAAGFSPRPAKRPGVRW